MEILGCGAIPIAKIKMSIAEMHNDSGQVVLCEKLSMTEGFWTVVPRHLAKKLTVGDTVTIICVPVKDFKFATETLALMKHTGERMSELIFDREEYYKLLST